MLFTLIPESVVEPMGGPRETEGPPAPALHSFPASLPSPSRTHPSSSVSRASEATDLWERDLSAESMMDKHNSHKLLQHRQWVGSLHVDSFAF